MKSFVKKNRLFIASTVAMLAFYLWVAAQIPYTHDDWDWGLEVGMQHLLKADINSRYVGNLIEVIITRSVILKTLIMGMILTLIPVSITIIVGKFIPKERKSSDLIKVSVFLFSNMMILLVPGDVWRQTNGWVAGFSNFVVSGLGLLLYLLFMIESDTYSNSPKWSLIKRIGLFVFGIVIQLFLENLTVFFFLFSVIFLIAKRKQKGIAQHIIPLLLGNLLGLMIMFSSNIYSSLWNTGYAIGTYRHLMYDPAKPLYVFIAESGLRYIGVFLPQIVFHNGILIGCIAGMMAVVILMREKKRITELILSAADIIFSIYYIFSYVKGNPCWDIHYDFGTIVFRPVITAIDCLFVALMIVEIILLFRMDRQLLTWLLVLWIIPFIIIVPMIMINTVGPRSFYTTDICFILFGGMIFSYIACKKQLYIVVLSILSLISVTVLGARWIKIYRPIGYHSRERERMIETAVSNGDKQIIFSEYPNSDYLWLPDPSQKDPQRVPYFKEFYHIPESVDIWFESWDK